MAVVAAPEQQPALSGPEHWKSTRLLPHYILLGFTPIVTVKGMILLHLVFQSKIYLYMHPLRTRESSMDEGAGCIMAAVAAKVISTV